jgi:hypothetical protein
MTFYVSDGNWTDAVKNDGRLISNGNGTSTYRPSYSTGYPNPAVGCTKQNFYSSYKCGKELTTRNIKTIYDAVNTSGVANFDCKDLFDKCNSLTLHLDDDGILTLKDSSSNKIWISTKDLTNAPKLATDVALPLAKYQPILANGSNNPDPNMPFKRSYLNSGEFLALGQYLGSPSGKCRLEMATPPIIVSTWTEVTLPFTTTQDKTLFKYGAQGRFLVSIIPSKNTTLTADTFIALLGGSATNTRLPNSKLYTTATQNEDWITIDSSVITVPKDVDTVMRYGSNNKFIYFTMASPASEKPIEWNAVFTFVRIAGEGATVTVPDNTYLRYGSGTAWVYRLMSGAVTANNGTFGDPISGVVKELQKSMQPFPVQTAAAPNFFQIKMSSTATSGNSLQVVYETLGCSEATPLSSTSSSLYTIPWTHRENLGKMGYVDDTGLLHAYADNSTMIQNYSVNFNKVGDYGMYGGDLGSLITTGLTGDEERDVRMCKQKCEIYGSGTYDPTVSNNQCIGFEYEKVGKTCQLKGPGALTGGIRRMNPSDGLKNYEYYSRIKGVSGLNPSCPSKHEDIVSGITSEWNSLTKGAAMTASTKCGLLSVAEDERNAVEVADASLNKVATTFGGTVTSLYNKYQRLKDALLNTQTDLSTKFNELNESKQNVLDWSGKQGEQLDAMNEDRDLNMMSQNYKHILWSILAILIVIGLIKFTKSFGGTKIADIVKTVEIPNPLAALPT